jgi:serine/threonine protein kinase
LGEDPKIRRTVAIKTMALAQEFDEGQLENVKDRFFREARTAGRLNHPNIVTIYDVGEEFDLAYIAMDYIEGENLISYTKADTLLPLADVFNIIGKVALALDYAQNENVVHRDIKPANVMYNPENKKVTVTDFGVACLTDSSKTKTGTVLGTPSYMSPEQLAGHKVDGRSDLFSLGVMFFQLVTGELPFIGDSMASLMYKITNEKHPDVRMFRLDLPPCVGRIIDKALCKEADKRFQTGKDFIRAINKCKESIEHRKKITRDKKRNAASQSADIEASE